MTATWFLCLTFVLSVVSADYNYYTLKQNGSTVVYNQPLSEDKYPKWLVKAFYKPSINQTGWNILEIQSSPDQEDDVQVYEAGYLEGYLTYQEIYNYWYNNVKDSCVNKTNICDKVREFFEINHNYVSTTSQKNLDDPFWYQVFLYNEQVKGLFDGFVAARKANSNLPDIPELSLETLIWINSFWETPDLMTAFGNRTEKQFMDNIGHCSALIKLLPGFEDIYFGHTAWTWYASMNRMLKRYTLPIHITQTSTQLIPGTQMTFSSYPGTIGSVDDFYLISSGLVAIETTNNVFDMTLYDKIKAQSQVLEMTRSMVANRLSSNGSSWKDYFSQRNSGTYNNQWMILDLNKFVPGFQPKQGLLWIVEQMPGRVVAEDMTDHIVAHGNWVSYNIPFFKKIYDYSGTNKMYKKYGDMFSYDKYFRAMIFRREVNNVTNLDSMLALIRYNHYKTDPYSKCEKCNPQQIPGDSISSRADLYPVNGTVVLPFKGYALMGGIDAKVSSYSLFSNGSLMLVQGGPSTSDDLPPFQWSKAQTQVSHLGQPDLWDFKPFLLTWAPHDPNPSSAALPSPSVAVYSIITFLVLNRFR